MPLYGDHQGVPMPEPDMNPPEAREPAPNLYYRLEDFIDQLQQAKFYLDIRAREGERQGAPAIVAEIEELLDEHTMQDVARIRQRLDKAMDELMDEAKRKSQGHAD